jgi:anti-sigma B factor antagonist
MSASTLLPTLRVVRRPGVSGPVVSCTGVLSEATAELLEQELELLVTLEHPALTVDLSGCRFADVDGMLALLEAIQRVTDDGRYLVIVAGTERMARLLRVTGLDQLLPVFATEEEAVRVLQLGRPPLVPATWTEAREAMVSCWREIEEALDEAPTEEVLRALTMTTALCERAQEVFRQRPKPAAWPCQFCPLFYALGGRPGDVGCRSLLDPIIAAVRTGERTTARALIDHAIHRLEEMPLPENGAEIFISY